MLLSFFTGKVKTSQDFLKQGTFKKPNKTLRFFLAYRKSNYILFYCVLLQPSEPLW